MRETWIQSLGWEDPLEKEMATHSSILAWEIPWTEEPGGLQSMGWQTAGHNLATKHHQPTQVSSRSNGEDRRERWGWIEQELGKWGIVACTDVCCQEACFFPFRQPFSCLLAGIAMGWEMGGEVYNHSSERILSACMVHEVHILPN